MLASFSMHRRIWLRALLAVLTISLTTTWAYENLISDGISMSISVLAIMTLLIVMSIWLFDAVNDICNP